MKASIRVERGKETVWKEKERDRVERDSVCDCYSNIASDMNIFPTHDNRAPHGEFVARFCLAIMRGK